MHSFDNGELANHFDNYVSEIASVHKYQTRLASLQKYHLPKMKRLWVSFLWSILVPKFGLTFLKIKNLLPYSFGKQSKNALLSYQNTCWFSFICLSLVYNIALKFLFSLISSTSTVAHPTGLYIGMLFSHCFLLFCSLIFSDVDLMHFVTFLLLSVKHIQLKIYLCQQQGWLRWQLWPSLPVPAFLIPTFYSWSGCKNKLNWELDP